jgi:uncharacterized protein (DUF1778 family)
MHGLQQLSETPHIKSSCPQSSIDMYGIIPCSFQEEVWKERYMKAEIETPKSARFEARITTVQKSLFQRAAALKGHRPLTEFVITSAQETAEIQIHESEVLRLSQQDRQTIVEALLHPPTPNKKLKSAGARFKKLVDTR